MATFGTDEMRSILGVDEVLTFDKSLIPLFSENRARIEERLDAIRREVQPPYDEAKLPEVVSPRERIE